jgi:hypothetical protein
LVSIAAKLGLVQRELKRDTSATERLLEELHSDV